MENSPSYIKALITPTAKKTQVRRVWSIDLMAVWLPFFTATNVMGDTAIPVDALGSPIRLAYNKDGSVRFSDSGRPVTRVAKELSQHVAMVRENFTVNLMEYASQVVKGHKEAYSKLVQSAHDAGQPIIQHDKVELDKAIQLQLEQALRDAEAQAEKETTPPAEKATTTPAEKEKVTA